MNYKQEYQRLKEAADEAFVEWIQSQNPQDWDYFMLLETNVADFALANEKEIWDGE